MSFWVSDSKSCLNIGSKGVYCIVKLHSSPGETPCMFTSTMEFLSPELLALNPDAVHRVLGFRDRPSLELQGECEIY